MAPGRWTRSARSGSGRTASRPPAARTDRRKRGFRALDGALLKTLQIRYQPITGRRKRKPKRTCCRRVSLDDLGPEDVVHMDDSRRPASLVGDDQARDGKGLHDLESLGREVVGTYG